MAKSSLERKGFIWFICPEPQSTEGSQGGNSNAGADAEALEGAADWCAHSAFFQNLGLTGHCLSD